MNRHARAEAATPVKVHSREIRPEISVDNCMNPGDTDMSRHSVTKFQQRRKISSVLFWNTVGPSADHTPPGSCLMRVANRRKHAPFRSHSLDSLQYLRVVSAASALGNVRRRYSGGRLKTRCSKRYFLMPRWIGWQVEQANNGDTLRHGLTAETNRHPWLSSPFHYERSGLRCGCPVARDWSTRRTVN